MKTAANNTQIPTTAEEILTVLEALAQMDQGTVQLLPQNVLLLVFRALKLSTLEQKEVMQMITADSVTIDKVKKFVNDRMLFFSMWSRTFHKTEQEHKASLGTHNQSSWTQAAGALSGAGGERPDRKPKRHNHEDDDENEYEDEIDEEHETTEEAIIDEAKEGIDSNRQDVNAICLYCRGKNMQDNHWISKCRVIESISKSELQGLFFCTPCLYLKKSNT